MSEIYTYREREDERRAIRVCQCARPSALVNSVLAVSETPPGHCAAWAHRAYSVCTVSARKPLFLWGLASMGKLQNAQTRSQLSRSHPSSPGDAPARESGRGREGEREREKERKGGRERQGERERGAVTGKV